MRLGLLLLVACGGAESDVRSPGPGGTPAPQPDPAPTTVPDPDPTDPSEETGRRWDCSGITQADPAPLGGRIALTFDDGPDPVQTPRILQLLDDYQIPATFFVLGTSLSDPDTWPIVEEMVRNPLFDIGNHSWDHADLALLPLSDVEAEIDDTTALIETFGVTPKFFRFPYGDSTCATHDLVTDRGYLVSGWHVDTVDWCYGADGYCGSDYYWRIPPEFEDDMFGFTSEQALRFDGGVVLMHDIHDATADMLEDLILELLADGFTFTSLDDAAAFPNLNAGIVADLPYLGESCDPIDDRCWQAEYLSWCEPTDDASSGGICTMPCEGYCVDRDGAATTFCMDVDPGAGQCVGRSDPLNAYCDALPGTVEVLADRHVGSSGASPDSADVCAPALW